jgi:GTP cyclohydrolase I
VDTINITWDEAWVAARACAARWADSDIDRVYGIPRGGVPPALMVAQILGVKVVDPMTSPPYSDPECWARNVGTTLVIDDLVDTGKTLGVWLGANPEGAVMHADALFRKPHSPIDTAPEAVELYGWLHFPWEPTNEGAPHDAVTRLLCFIGEDPSRQGLVDTPKRYVKALAEMTEGYRIDAGEVLDREFDEHSDEMIVVRGVTFTSLCEHHLLPFTGTVDVGYIPGEGKGVVGLSKLARLVELHARRLQVQERMTRDIAEDLLKHLEPMGAGVVVRAVHDCMACRGIKKAAEMITSSLHGAMRDDARARAEFLALTR